MHVKSIPKRLYSYNQKGGQTKNMAQDIAETLWNEYGYLAASKAAQKDIDGARAMLKKAPLKTTDEHARKRLDIMYDVDEAVQRVAGDEANTYLLGLNSTKATDLPKLYGRSVSKLSGPGQEGLVKFLEKYAGGKTVGQMKRMQGELEGIANAEPGVYPDAERQKAAETLKALKPYFNITETFAQGHYKPLLREVEADKENATYKSIDELLTSGQF